MEIAYKELTNGPDDYNIFVNFLKKVDKEFRVPLSAKCSLDQYAHKLLENGHVIVFYDVKNGHIISSNGFYCNDRINRTAYVTMLCSLPESRGMGLARKLLLKMFEISIDNGMDRVISCSVNPIAIHLYKSVGFKEISSTEENSLTTIQLSYKFSK